MSWDFVTAWTKSSDQDFNQDKRGWIKGRGRKYTEEDKQIIQRLREELKNNPNEFFYGDKAILQLFQEKFLEKKEPSISFTNRTLSVLGLTDKRQKKQPGLSRYLHYPDHTIKQLDGVILEIDFIGEKFIKEQTEPINFIAFSYQKPFKLKQFKRILAAKKDCAIEETDRLFKLFPVSDYAKVDNGLAFIGSASAKRSLSDFVFYLFKRKSIPIFTAPREPWNQASVEGSNSVFTKKFWNRYEFTSIKEIDEKLRLFNQAYLKYSRYQNQPELPQEKKKFIPQIFFIRKVYAGKQSEQGFIDVLNEKLFLPKSYINLFVLTYWNLKTETLTILFERDKKLFKIKKYRFLINKLSKRKLSGFIW